MSVGSDGGPVRLGIVADTHIGEAASRVLPPALLRGLAGVDYILHAGDMTARRVLDQLGQLAPVLAVTGNQDTSDLSYALPTARLLRVGGLPLGLTHGHLGRARTTPARALQRFAGVEGLRAVVFGHSHEPLNTHPPEHDVLLFNPGSPTERRRQRCCSYGLLFVEDGVVRGDIIYLP